MLKVFKNTKKKKIVEQKFVLNEYSYHDGIQKGDMVGVYHSYGGN